MSKSGETSSSRHHLRHDYAEHGDAFAGSLGHGATSQSVTKSAWNEMACERYEVLTELHYHHDHPERSRNALVAVSAPDSRANQGKYCGV
jgi:hypothetical protein